MATLEQGREALKLLVDLFIEQDLLTTPLSDSLERVENALDVIQDREDALSRAPKFR